MLVRSPHVTPATAELHVGRSVTGVFLALLACSGVQAGDNMCLEKEERWGGGMEGRPATDWAI